MADGGTTPEHPAPDGPGPATRIVVLLFSDIVGSTALPAKFGAAPYAAALRLHNGLFERLAAEESVTIVKFTGDGYFAWCRSAAGAVRFALRFQQSMRDMAWGGVVLTTRLGIHLGEVSDFTIAGHIDMIGPAANLASRLMSVGLGGQILLSHALFDEGRLHVSAHPPCGNAPAPELEWLAHRHYYFNGYEEPVEVFEVGAKGLAPLIPPPDSEKAWRALRPGDEETSGWRPAEGIEIPGRPGWRIVEKLGAGGFGEVWTGQRVKTGERRAFKFCFDAERLRALKREVALIRLLRETLGDREDIVRIHELRLDAKPYFLESELATDGNLLQWAERQGGLAAIPLEARLELVAATATALAAAHSVGVLHKDIKPTNVLIFTGKDGRARPRLVDFGIGTLADPAVLAQHGISGSGFSGGALKLSTGTPTYRAPEHLAGKPFTVQGDVYSLGVMLWQLVAAKPDRPLAEGWQRDVGDPLLREDIALCVDGDPARRLPAAAELATRLRALPERTAETARRVAAEAADTARHERQRRLRLTTAIAILIAAVAIPLAVWAVVKQREAEKEKSNAQEQTRLAKIAEGKAKAQVQEASRSDTATAQARLAEGKWQEAVAYLGRAIRYDPENRNAQEALWLALRHGRRDAGRLPIHMLPHGDIVRSASFSPDGSRLVTASDDKTARIWDTDSGLPIGTPLVHQSLVWSASFSPDGSRVITVSRDNTARIWDTKSGQPIGAPLTHQNSLISASFSPDGSRVLTASDDRTARIWDANSGQPIGAPLTHDDRITSASFSPDGSRVITASVDKTARIWDAKSGQLIGAPLTHQRIVSSASFSSYGSRMVTASWDGTAHIWDAISGERIGVPLTHDGSVRSASFSPDGARVVTASDDKTARIWDAKSGQPIGTPLTHDSAVVSASFSPEGSRVVTASDDRTARIWDAKSGQPIGAPLPHRRNVTSASFSADGSRVVTASDDKTARIWDAKSGQAMGAPLTHQSIVTSASFSPDGSSVVTASWDETARIWDAKSGQPIGTPLTHGGRVASASFSPDGSRVVTASYDNTARIWDAKSGQPIGVPLTHGNWVNSASFSPDGSRVLTASDDNTARIWDAKSGQPIGAPLTHEDRITSASFSPDGSRVVTASYDKTACIWDAISGQPIGAPLTHDGSVRSASFSSDGARVVTASDDNTARIWDAKSGQPIGTPLTHQGNFTSASFSPDGSRVLTTSSDNTARIWDAISGQPIGIPLTHQGNFTSASFSPDGSRVVTASYDNTARIWDAKSGQPISIPLTHKDSLPSASFGPDGSRVLTASEDKTARVRDVRTGQVVSADLAEMLTAFSGGARLDPELGSLQFLSEAERLALAEALAPLFDTSEDWRFAASLRLPNDPQTTPVSPRMTMTIRDVSARLIGTLSIPLIREAAACDPNHPVLPFAHALIEVRETLSQPANPIRTAWLCDYGMKHFPADTSAADLRLATRLVAEVAKTIPEQKATALLLLDRAAKLAPEDEDTKALRERLK